MPLVSRSSRSAGLFVATSVALTLSACGKDSEESAASASASASTTETGSDTDTSGGESETGSALTPTWYQDVAPLVAERCTGCHRDGGIAPSRSAPTRARPRGRR
ncbi:MAG: hypothetical protein R3B09_19110 [Nannocystaceae bacterium]